MKKNDKQTLCEMIIDDLENDSTKFVLCDGGYNSHPVLRFNNEYQISLGPFVFYRLVYPHLRYFTLLEKFRLRTAIKQWQKTPIERKAK